MKADFIFLGNSFALDDGILYTTNNGKFPVEIIRDAAGIQKISFFVNGVIQKVHLDYLLCYVRFPLHLPVKYWKQLKVSHIDNDRENNELSNLIWRFPRKGISHDHFPDFRYIPHYTRYGISKDGRVIDFLRLRDFVEFGKTLTCHSGSEDKHGNSYRRFSVIPDERLIDRSGKAHIVPRHRLIGLAWLDYPNNYDDLVINHINGVKGDDRINNLEWLTEKENSIHAVELGLTSSTRMKAFEYGSNIERKFRSLCAASQHYSVERETIRNHLKKDPPTVFRTPKGLVSFKYSFDTTPWKTHDNPLKASYERRFSYGIDMRNIRTGEIHRFDSLTEASKFLGISITTICNALNRGSMMALYGYQIKKVVDETPWPELNKYQVEVYSRRDFERKGCLLKDRASSEEVFYPSLNAAAKELGYHAGTFVKKAKLGLPLGWNKLKKNYTVEIIT